MEVTPRTATPTRVQIQFRLGASLVAKIDAAAEADNTTRNDWLVGACLDKLAGKGSPGAFVASEVTADRLPILFRVSGETKRRIDADYKAKGISSRTMWIVEAILGKLDEYDFN